MTDNSTSAQPEVWEAAEPIRTVLARLEGDERLDSVADAIDPLATKANEGAIGHVLRGDWLGHAVHPLLTDFPLGCWIAAGLLDVVGGRRSRPAAARLIGLGLLAVPPTVASGVAEFGTIEERTVRRVGAAHAAGNAGVALMYLLSWRARRRGHHVRGMAWSLGGGGLALVAGYLGGHLALALGVGSGERGLDGGGTRGAGTTDQTAQPATATDHDVSDPGVSLLEAADTAGVPIDTSP